MGNPQCRRCATYRQGCPCHWSIGRIDRVIDVLEEQLV